MTIDEQIKKITEWQDCIWVHPLTCGNDSRHAKLVPFVVEKSVLLKCVDCGYIQNRIPGMVFSDFVKMQDESIGLILNKTKEISDEKNIDGVADNNKS